MISLRAAAVRALLRLYTYPARKRHTSLSRTAKFKSGGYCPPAGYTYTRMYAANTAVEVISPPCARSGAAIVQFHGGGHTQGMNDMYRSVAARLAKMTDCAVYSIDYAAAEGLVFPSVHDECFAAYCALSQGALKGNRIITIGDSFGANLMLSSCLRLRDGGMSLPAAVICISPYVDMAASGASYEYNCRADPLYGLPKSQSYAQYSSAVRRISPYCGNTPKIQPLLSPAYGNFRGFPDMFVSCGGLETSASDSHMLVSRVRQSGVRVQFHEYGGMWHDFAYMFPRLKESKAAWRHMHLFVDDILSR